MEQLALIQMARAGLLAVPLAPYHVLFWVFWASVILGAAIQRMLLRRARTRFGRGAFAAVLVLGLLAGEVACQTVTGWDLLLPLLLYWWCGALTLGAGLAALIRWIVNIRRS